MSAVNSLQEAVNTILKFLGLGAANLSEKVLEGTHTHTLLCSGIIMFTIIDHCIFMICIIEFCFFFKGVFRGGVEALVRAKLALADGVTMQLTVRSTNQDVAELVSSAIG